MIIADRFLWLHLPKTGCTSMNRLFRDRLDDGVRVDPDDTPAKHDSVAFREQKSSWKAGDRRRFITYRPLEAWLISDWRHKCRHLNQADLDFTPVRSGLFYSLRLGGIWVTADWWLQYFEVTSAVTPLRLSHMSEDLNQHILPLLSPGTEAFEMLPRENAAAQKSAPTNLFSPEDRLRIAANNPRWTSWDQNIQTNSR